MEFVYYLFLAMSIGAFLYGIINLILVDKFVNSLSTIMKSKYSNLVKLSKGYLAISFISVLVHVFIPVILFKCLVCLISMLLSGYTISEISVLKKYI